MKNLLMLISVLLFANLGYTQEVVKDYPKEVEHQIRVMNRLGYSFVKVHEVKVSESAQSFTFDVFSGNFNDFTVISTNKKLDLKLELWGYEDKNWSGKDTDKITKLKTTTVKTQKANTSYSYRYSKGKHQITVKALNVNGKKKGKLYFLQFYKSHDNKTRDANNNKAIDASIK